MGLVTLKLVCESHLRWGTRHARLLDSRIIRYIYNGQMDKSNSYCPLPYGGGGIIKVL